MRETSVEAYINVVESGVLGRSQEKVYRILYEHGPMSGADLAAYGGVTPSGSTLFKRVSELERLGIVRCMGIRSNGKTGRAEMLWGVTTEKATGPARIHRSRKVLQENEACAKIADDWSAEAVARCIRRRVEQ